MTNWRNAIPVVLLLQPVLLNNGTFGLLLGKRGILPDIGAWVFSGGHTEKGETGRMAAVREFFEESGREVGPSTVHSLGDMPSGNGEHQLLFYHTTDFIHENDISSLERTEEMTDWMAYDGNQVIGWPTHKLVADLWLMANRFAAPGSRDADFVRISLPDPSV